MKLKKRVKRLWVAALRSGKYEQATEVLKDGAGYCCLGVLCEIAKKEGVIKYFNSGDGYPPPEVYKWAALPDGEVGESKTDSFLVELNDKHRASFKRIAAYIERWM